MLPESSAPGYLFSVSFVRLSCFQDGPRLEPPRRCWPAGPGGHPLAKRSPADFSPQLSPGHPAAGTPRSLAVSEALPRGAPGARPRAGPARAAAVRVSLDASFRDAGQTAAPGLWVTARLTVSLPGQRVSRPSLQSPPRAGFRKGRELGLSPQFRYARRSTPPTSPPVGRDGRGPQTHIHSECTFLGCML